MTTEEQIDAITLSVCEQFAGDVIADLHQRLDTPFPPASSPGESPHKRTSDLRDSAQYFLVAEGSRIELTITVGGVDAPYAGWLEGGTSRMAARPFMAPTLEIWAPILIERLRAAFGGTPPVVSPAGTIVPMEILAA